MNDEHKAVDCFNNGWDDDPSWQIVCECDWEAWRQPSEAAARESHHEDRAELLLTGECSCATCQSERVSGGSWIGCWRVTLPCQRVSRTHVLVAARHTTTTETRSAPTT